MRDMLEVIEEALDQSNRTDRPPTQDEITGFGAAAHNDYIPWLIEEVKRLRRLDCAVNRKHSETHLPRDIT